YHLELTSIPIQLDSDLGLDPGRFCFERKIDGAKFGSDKARTEKRAGYLEKIGECLTHGNPL
ncbi:MAG: hypothetical protein AAGA40_14680, partial [Cyanobacteria bacterium P01_E01_bin.45]